MKSKVQKWGNSLALRIPRAFAEEAQVEEGADVDLQLKGGHLIIIPLRSKKTLKELLAAVKPEHLRDETDTGKSVGSEVW